MLKLAVQRTTWLLDIKVSDAAACTRVTSWELDTCDSSSGGGGSGGGVMMSQHQAASL